MDRKMFAALKSGGLLVFADHAAKPGSDISVGKTLHRFDEAVVRRELEAVGFKLIGEGNFWPRRPSGFLQFAPDRSGGRVRTEVPEADVKRPAMAGINPRQLHASRLPARRRNVITRHCEGGRERELGNAPPPSRLP